MHQLSEVKVAVIGLGYVGLPLAAEFGKLRSVVGFDINQARIDALEDGYDATLEVSPDELREASRLRFTGRVGDIAECNVFIVTVPTPIDKHKRPDLTPLINASHTIGQVLKKGDIVIYESTVYPGATEDECVPILEKVSGLKLNLDFYAGYSPERINPGDKRHRIKDIKKVTSGSSPEAADLIDELYQQIVVAGTHKATSIKVAEAAKVIENTQRDLNIALVNELAIIFNRMGIDTEAVLRAAGTKWNFLPFWPGLVGGHCIGVDPYYLTYKAELAGYHPEVILAGRRINDGMGSHVARKTVQQMIHAGRNIKGARVNILGLTFKENVPDIRNSKVIDIVRELHEFGVQTYVHDPLASAEEALVEYGLRLCPWNDLPAADALVLAVPHRAFLELGPAAYLEKLVRRGCLIDVKSVCDAAAFRREGVSVWRL